jgi:hypothetical protein
MFSSAAQCKAKGAVDASVNSRIAKKALERFCMGVETQLGRGEREIRVEGADPDGP